MMQSHAWDPFNRSLGFGRLVGTPSEQMNLRSNSQRGRSQATLNWSPSPPMGGAKHIPPHAALSRSCSATCRQTTQRHPNAVYYPDHSLVISLSMRLPAVSCAWPCPLPLTLLHTRYTLQTSKQFSIPFRNWGK